MNALPHTEGSSNKAFGIVFAIFFTIIGCWPLLKSSPVRWWALIIASIFLLLALALPQSLSFLNRLWTRFGYLLHKITSPIALGIIFYLTVAPMGLVMRAFKKDLLRLRMDKQATTYWIKRTPPGPDPKTMHNPF